MSGSGRSGVGFIIHALKIYTGAHARAESSLDTRDEFTMMYVWIKSGEHKGF